MTRPPAAGAKGAPQRPGTDELLRAADSLPEALIDCAPVGFALFDREMRFVRVNEALARLDGIAVEDHRGRRPTDLYPGAPAEDYTVPFRRVLEGAEPVPDLEITGSDSHERQRWLSSWYPVRLPGDDRVIGVGMFLTDVSGRARAERGLQLLSDVGEALHAALEVGDRLAVLARLLVPTMADFCLVDTLDPSGRPVAVAYAHVEPEGESLLRELRRHTGLEPGSPLGIARALRTGTPGFSAVISEEAIEAYAAERPEAGAILRRLAPRSAIIVPLHARGQLLGALTLAMSSSRRRHDEHDLAIARQLARRVGLAIDNALLYQEQRDIAHTLQQSLLPPELPELPGLELAARYLAMGDGNEVGGDFYDVFEAGRSWAAVIGDVCGKGAEAAALTSLLRHTIRTLARHDPRPSRLLSDLNDAIVRERGLDPRFSTAVYARLVPDRGGISVVVGSAGHPLPLVVRAGGRVEELGSPGTLLGPFATVRVRDAAARLAPGDALVLYTDGVTEARRDGDLYGEERLHQALAELAGRPAEEIAAGIERSVVSFHEGPLADDLAVLVVRVGLDAG